MLESFFPQAHHLHRLRVNPLAAFLDPFAEFLVRRGLADSSIRAVLRSGVEDWLALAFSKASEGCPSLRGKAVSPHTIRHTTAMHLLQSGVDLTVIALWLGHESPQTTHQYVEADLKMKEEVLTKVEGVPVEKCRYKAKPAVLDFLDKL
jgi:integrase/recombinase XerD